MMERSEKHKVWKPFHATDFNSLMHPCFFVCGILGFFPYKCESSTYALSKIRFIYTTLAMITFLIALLVFVSEINFSSSMFQTIPKKIHFYFYIITLGSILLITYIPNGGKLKLLQALSDVSSMLTTKDFNDLARLCHAKDIAMFLFLACHLPRCITTETVVTLRNFVILYMTVSSSFIDTLYMNFVCVLKACFARINDNLDQLKKPATQRFLYHEQRAHLLLTKLKNFEAKHLQISDVLQLLNKIFLVRIVVTTITTFTIVTFNLYFYLLWSRGGERDNEYLGFWYVPYVSSAIYHFAKFTMVIWACETATTQAARIHTTLHDILGEATDLSIKREVELFSLQVIHSENTFTTRLFNMNASLLTQIMGGIVMYFLILIQFLLNTVLCMMA